VQGALSEYDMLSFLKYPLNAVSTVACLDKKEKGENFNAFFSQKGRKAALYRGFC